MEPLGFDGGNKVAAKIAKLDPEGRYVRLNLVTHSVEYSREFEFGEEISDFTGEEEICRAFIVCWLCTIGGYLPNCIALERRYSIGRPKTGAELDILLRRVDGLAYALIEVKAPLDYTVDQDSFIKGQLFNIAPHEEGTSVLSFATVQIRHAGPEIVCKTIDYKTYRRFEDWVLSRAFSNQIPTNYGEPEHVYLVNGGPRDLRPATGVPELTRIRKRLHDVLWRGATPDNTIYAYVVKIFLAKTHDEKTTNRGTRYRLQIKYPGNKREPSSQTFQNVSDLYKAAYRKYMGLSEDAAVDGLNETEFSPEQTAFVVEIIQELSLVKTTQANPDLLGRFFEGITRDGFKQSKGLFFTHQNIVSFMIYVLDVIGLVDRKIKSDRLATEKLPYIIDPACGSGTFLLSAMNHITDHVIATAETLMTNDDVKEFVAAHFPNGQENLWAKDFLYGLDATEVLALSAKVNMLLRRDGQAHIYHSDGLAPLPSYKETRLRGTPHRDRSVYSKHVSASFDVVISNPPFSITLDQHTLRNLKASFELSSEGNSENLFLERWYQLLKPGGRLGVVLPESFFSTKENLDVRLFLFSHFRIKAIVSLPKEAFEPWTPTRTSLLFAEKRTVEEEGKWKNQVVKWEARGLRAKKAAQRAALALQRSTLDLQQGHTNGRFRDFRRLGKECGAGSQELTGAASIVEIASAVERVADAIAHCSGKHSQKNSPPHIIQVKRMLRWLNSRIAAISDACDVLPKANRLLGLDNDPITLDNTIEELAARARQYVISLKRLDHRVWAFRKVAPSFRLSVFPVCR